MPPQTITLRQLNRATLARQGLLEPLPTARSRARWSASAHSRRSIRTGRRSPSSRGCAADAPDRRPRSRPRPEVDRSRDADALDGARRQRRRLLADVDADHPVPPRPVADPLQAGSGDLAGSAAA